MVMELRYQRNMDILLLLVRHEKKAFKNISRYTYSFKWEEDNHGGYRRAIFFATNMIDIREISEYIIAGIYSRFVLNSLTQTSFTQGVSSMIDIMAMDWCLSHLMESCGLYSPIVMACESLIWLLNCGGLFQWKMKL